MVEAEPERGTDEDEDDAHDRFRTFGQTAQQGLAAVEGLGGVRSSLALDRLIRDGYEAG